MQKYIIPLVLLSLISCGKDSKDSVSLMTLKESQNPILGVEYRAIIRPINTRLNGIIASGLAKIKIEQDQFNIVLYMDDLGSVGHKQFIYSGECPNPTSDVNSDKIIDMNELSGNPVLSLDSDLNSEASVNDHYPFGRSYNYSESASLSKITANQATETESTTFNFDRKVIIIFGAPTSTSVPIPSTVANMSTEPTHLNVPVACGVIEKI